jgi:hypothetical protein
MSDLVTGRGSEGGHWYTRTGECCYEIKGANGKMRSVTLRDARKLGLVPGFSAISKMEHKEQLERWKIEQAFMSCLTLPRVDGESLQEFMRRAKEDSQAQSNKARDRGTALHAALQGYYEGAPLDMNDLPYVMPVVKHLRDRFGDIQWCPEQSFAHEFGFGGKSDLNSPGRVVIDFKFKDFSDPEKIKGYDDHEMQLHAYALGFGMLDAIKLNLFISSTVPGLIVPVEWPTNPHAVEAFKCLLRLWQIRRGYDSSFSLEKAAA